MLGFIVSPRGQQWLEKGQKAFSALRSASLDSRYDVGDSSVWVYRTPQANDYRHVAASGRVLIATGTLMLGVLRGNAALAEIAQRLDRRDSLDAIYTELRGAFALLMMDKARGRVELLTDRDGLLCCYQARSGQSPLMGTSLLLLATLTGASLDPVGVQEFVHGGAAVNGRSLFSGISRVPKASATTIDADGISSRRLWQMTVHSPYLQDSDKIIVDRMDELFATALRTDLRDAQRSFGADLTAGTDSRTVFAYLLAGGQPVVASTAGPADNVDVSRARHLAALAGVEHFWYPADGTNSFDQNDVDDCVEQCDGAMSPFSLINQRKYFVEKARRFDILFGGNGGPLFKDHYWLFEFNQIDQSREPNWGRIARFSLTEGPVDQGLFAGGIDYLPHMERFFLETSERIQGTNNQKLDFMYFDLKMSSFAAPQFSFSNRYMDVYHPMCDAKLVEYSLSIRPWIRQRARLQSELIYRHNKRLAWVLTDNAVPCVPDTGLRYPLRLTRAVRYGRALKRKVRDFVLSPSQRAPDPRATSFVSSLQATELGDLAANPRRMQLAPLLQPGRVEQLLTAARAGAHSGYLQRLMGVEAIVRHVSAAQARLMA